MTTNSDPWKRYQVLRLQAVIGILVAGYLARVPYDLSHLSLVALGAAIPAQTLNTLTWAMFPVAAIVVALTAGRWMWFTCPGCKGSFFGFGPKVAGRSILVNPMAGHCRTCHLVKGAAATVAATNVVPFDEIVRMRIATMDAIRGRKQA